MRRCYGVARLTLLLALASGCYVAGYQVGYLNGWTDGYQLWDLDINEAYQEGVRSVMEVGQTSTTTSLHDDPGTSQPIE